MISSSKGLWCAGSHWVGDPHFPNSPRRCLWCISQLDCRIHSLFLGRH